MKSIEKIYRKRNEENEDFCFKESKERRQRERKKQRNEKTRFQEAIRQLSEIEDDDE